MDLRRSRPCVLGKPADQRNRRRQRCRRRSRPPDRPSKSVARFASSATSAMSAWSAAGGPSGTLSCRRALGLLLARRRCFRLGRKKRLRDYGKCQSTDREKKNTLHGLPPFTACSPAGLASKFKSNRLTVEQESGCHCPNPVTVLQKWATAKRGCGYRPAHASQDS